jgi:hypothetical protein
VKRHTVNTSMFSLSGVEVDYLKTMTAVEAEIHMKEMREAGFRGSVGSQDATHIGMERCVCSYDRWNMHKGANLNMLSHTYNMTVSHRCCILSTMTGHLVS